MKHRDLGVLDGAVLLFGGPYSNAQALRALMTEAQARGISRDHMVCTGDIVAYAGEPAECVAMIRALGCPVIAGNCEVQLASGAADCGCGFEEGSACDLLSVTWFNYAAQVLQDKDKTWMGALPDLLTFVHQGARYGVLHGGITEVARFVWPTSPNEVFAEEWQAFEAIAGPVDHIIAGHSGVPFIKTTSKGHWINAGVIGMPPHDGGQQTRFAVLDGGEVQVHRLSYDAAGAANAMDEAGLPAGYRDGLLSGYWPSEDVLPAALRVPSLAKG